MFAQPSYGVAYGLLLVPAVVVIYGERRALGIGIAAMLPVLLGLAYAPGAGLVTMFAGMAARPVRYRGLASLDSRSE
jgi:cytochrome c biogenesis protein CcdA